MKSRTFKTIVFIIITALPLCSCQKELKHMHAGDGIRFTAGSGFAQTKASYSGTTNSAGTAERIDWQAGDLLRIYCAQASEPAVHYADYKVTSVDSPASGSAVSTAHIETFSDATDGIGLRWGESDHLFYAAFPSPATTGGITTSISANEVAASLSATQVPVSVTGGGINYTAVPDLRNMLMTAKAGPYTAETMPDENTVFLAFTPLTTAVKFTITNQTKADLTLKSVSLISASSALNGPFTVDIDDESHQPESVNLGGTTISYLHTYPYCQYTGTVSDATKKVTINFATPVTLPYYADIANCGKLTFTFFLQPCQNFDDLTFKLVKSDDSWMSTRLGYTDGTGILFPRFKKSEVNGVFVPEGAQWTVKYDPTVQSWDTESGSDIDPMPETDGAPFVTSWDTGIEEELTLKKQPVDLYSVSATKKVRFAQGNLYWDGNAGEYKFEANQYDYRNVAGILYDAAVINGVETTTPANTVGSFLWVKNTEVNIKPYDSSYGTPSPADAATDILFTNNTADTPNADFTVNGQTGLYRTLSDTEWGYLKQARTVNGGHGEGYSYSINIIYCGVHGVVLYPDNYLGTPLASGTSCTELPEGVVFLPASGFKYGNNFSSIGDIGSCLASTSNSEGSGYNMKFQISNGSFGVMGNSRSISIALRPVVDVTE